MPSHPHFALEASGTCPLARRTWTALKSRGREGPSAVRTCMGVTPRWLAGERPGRFRPRPGDAASRHSNGRESCCRARTPDGAKGCSMPWASVGEGNEDRLFVGSEKFFRAGRPHAPPIPPMPWAADFVTRGLKNLASLRHAGGFLLCKL